MRVELDRVCERPERAPREPRVSAALFCAVSGTSHCVNLRASDARPRRMPPAVVSKPGDDGLLPLDMRPMLPSDSAYFRSHPLMVPVEGVMPKELTDTYHQARSGGRIQIGRAHV